MKKNFHFFLVLLLPVQVLALSFLGGYPLWVEHYYSNGIYPVIAKLERIIFGWIPFSMGDFLYTFLGILLLRWLYLRIKTRFKKPRVWIIQSLSAFSIFYFCFHFLWGLNYYRLPLHQSLKIEDDYTTEELVKLSEKLIENANLAHLKLVQQDSIKVEYPYSNQLLRKLAVKGYENLAQDYPELAYSSANIKPSLYTIPLTYMGFNGYLNPFTNEAQINNWIPAFKMPSTISHEIGHQIGFAKENEANFIACLATINHPDPYFKYSGYTFALQYCLGELSNRDRCLAENLVAQLHPGILKNYKEVDLFWKTHENPMEPFFKLFYGNFLKVNNQPQGIESYNYVVALLVNYFEKEGHL